MENILALIAVGLFVASITTGIFTENTWKNTVITWALLAAGMAVFGVVLTF